MQHAPAGADLARKGLGQIAGAARDVEHLLAFAHARGQHHVGLPQAMQAAGHEVVHEVIARRDRIENLAHAPGRDVQDAAAQVQVQRPAGDA